jgi:hypothetical protein
MKQRDARRPWLANVNTVGPCGLLRFSDCQLYEIDPPLPSRIYRGGGKSVVSPETGRGPGH